MGDLLSEPVLRCIRGLTLAKNPSEAILSWLLLEKSSSNFCAIVSLPDWQRISIPDSLRRSVAERANCLVPYFASENLYFIDDEMIREMLNNEVSNFGVDYSIMFDTNVASYINKLVRGESLGRMQGDVVRLIDGMLHDGLNFDHLFYMAENSKNIYKLILSEQTSKYIFWKALNRKFRQSLVSLQLFNSIDLGYYKRTSAPRFAASYRESFRNAVEFAYSFYASPVGREHMLGFLLVQRMILLQLIGMVKIQFSSSRSASHKLREYFSFISETLGVYFDRETILAHKYFLNKDSVGAFKKINRGHKQKNLLKKLDNLAWDMASPRFMEKLISTGGLGKYFVPFFLTFDEELRNVLSLYQVKGVLIKKGDGGVFPVPEVDTYSYFEEHGCAEVLRSFYQDSARRERKKPTLESLHRSIFHEYRKLYRVMCL